MGVFITCCVSFKETCPFVVGHAHVLGQALSYQMEPTEWAIMSILDFVGLANIVAAKQFQLDNPPAKLNGVCLNFITGRNWAAAHVWVFRLKMTPQL